MIRNFGRTLLEKKRKALDIILIILAVCSLVLLVFTAIANISLSNFYLRVGQSFTYTLHQIWLPWIPYLVVELVVIIFGFMRKPFIMLFLLAITYPTLVNSMAGIRLLSGLEGLFYWSIWINNHVSLLLVLLNVVGCLIWCNYRLRAQ